MARKIFVLSSNALVSSTDACLRLGVDNEVIIPLCVIDELSKLAKHYNQKGQNAQHILNYLEKFDINKLKSVAGVRPSEYEDSSILRVEDGYKDVEVEFDNLTYSEKRRLQIALGLYKVSNCTVILISSDSSFRIKARALGLKAMDYKDEIFPKLKDQYTGRLAVKVPNETISYFDRKGFFEPQKLLGFPKFNLIPNMFLEISNINYPDRPSKIGRFDGENIVKLQYDNYHPFGCTALTMGQKMLIEAMMTPCEQSQIVIVKSCAGTGKTFQALACGIEQVLELRTYKDILISTSVSTVGDEHIGYLPGEIEQKFTPYLGGLKANLRIIFQTNGSNKSKKDCFTPCEDGTFLFEDGKIQMLPLGFMRGCTFVNEYIIVDKVQNIHPDLIKSIVTRVGTGSKIVLLGDPSQIDNPSLNDRFNGLVYVSEKFKNYTSAWQVTLDENESVRSELAKYAAQTL